MKRAAVAGGIGLVIAGGLWYTGLDASVHNQPAKGVVESVSAAAGMSTNVVENALTVRVKLADGREATVLALKTNHPTVGENIEIVEHIHGTGRSTFSWK